MTELLKPPNNNEFKLLVTFNEPKFTKLTLKLLS
jgi:hypothetical protein